MVIRICVGSSCHIKGSPELVALLQEAVAAHGMENEITLSGSFCTGSCNRVGVTIQVEDEIYTGITTENFREFFAEKVLAVIEKERK